MRATGLKRKTRPRAPIWSVSYLSSRALLRALEPACAQLTGDLLDLGSGNSPYRSLLTRIERYVPYDLDRSNKGVLVIGAANVLPFVDGAFDSVLCTQVLEHVAHPASVVAEIARVLRPNGRLVLSAPMAWRLHEQPHDYFRYTRYGLASLLNDAHLHTQSCEPTGGTWTLTGQIINNHVWRNPPANRITWVISRAACTLASTVINASTVALDTLFYDPDDTLNFVVVAHKQS